MYRLLAICFALAIIGSFGCSSSQRKGPAPTAPVKGTVTMDAKPLRTGEIHFGILGYPPQISQITNGTYSGEAPIGKNQVEIYIYVDGPPSPKNPGVPTKINTSPPRYWGRKTTLAAEVAADGANEFKFDLTSSK
jgi:hypothetical protein